MSRIELARLAVSGQKSARAAAKREAGRRIKENKRMTATASAGKRLVIAAAVSTLPAYVLTKNPDMAYLDEDQTIETELVFSGGLLALGLGYYIMKPDAPYAEEALEAGIVSAACYLNHRTRQMAAEDLLEDAETLADAA